MPIDIYSVVMCTEDTKNIENEWGFHEISNGFLGCFQDVSRVFLGCFQRFPGDSQGISRGFLGRRGQWVFREFPVGVSGGFQMVSSEFPEKFLNQGCLI